jgi:hypothetical protein
MEVAANVRRLMTVKTESLSAKLQTLYHSSHIDELSRRSALSEVRIQRLGRTSECGRDALGSDRGQSEHAPP